MPIQHLDVLNTARVAHAVAGRLLHALDGRDIVQWPDKSFEERERMTARVIELRDRENFGEHPAEGVHFVDAKKHTVDAEAFARTVFDVVAEALINDREGGA